MSDSVKRMCRTAMGIALFVVLSLCLQVPVFENYYLCLGYVAMTVYCWSYGSVAGAEVGALGVVIYCLITDGLRGMPGWALGNVFIGLVLGNVFRIFRRREPGRSGDWAGLSGNGAGLSGGEAGRSGDGAGYSGNGHGFSGDGLGLLDWVVLVGVIVLTCGIAMLGVKSLTESLLYSQPMAIRMAKNVYAFAADAFVIAVSVPFAKLLGKRLLAAGENVAA